MPEVANNGPAIKGVCVTRRPSGQCPYSLAGMLSRWARGYGTRFCLPIAIGTATDCREYTGVAVQTYLDIDIEI